ncbi:MAG: 2-octaprenyl-6-methoxyphenyl hydroxylase [Cellvibrionaceae bacterium]|nr:2-octaprenyl-6-methoxyphenyl hydroxylase [Cellvibrionaceae bacterium]
MQKNTIPAINRHHEQQHIVIVGGGMVGLSLALLLARQQFASWSITVLEQHDSTLLSDGSALAPSFDARATALSAGSWQILQQLGLSTALKDVAELIKTIDVSDRGHYGGAVLQHADHGVEALGYVLENRHLGQVLLSAIKRHQVNYIAPVKVLKCVPKRLGYDLYLQQGEQLSDVRANLLLVADGAHSSLRQCLGIGATTTAYKQHALIANVALRNPHCGVAYERFTDQGPIALLPLPPVAQKNRASVVWTLPQQQADTMAKASTADLLAQLQRRFGYRAGTVLDIGKRYTYPLQLITSVEQIRSRLVVIGNAAHFLHPVAGQGFNLALRDCAALVEVLSNAHQQGACIGDCNVLQKYRARQALDQDFTIALTHHLVSAFGSKNTVVSILRQLGFMGLNSLPGLKRRFAQQLMGGFR